MIIIICRNIASVDMYLQYTSYIHVHALIHHARTHAHTHTLTRGIYTQVHNHNVNHIIYLQQV